MGFIIGTENERIPVMKRLFWMIMVMTAFAVMKVTAAAVPAKFDTDGDGKVSKKEWVDARLKGYEAAGKTTTAEKLEKAFDSTYDLDHDGFADEIK